MSEQPRHTEGQGEVCDPTCPHWGWAASRSVASATGGEPTTEATPDASAAPDQKIRNLVHLASIGALAHAEAADRILHVTRSSAAEASAGAGPAHAFFFLKQCDQCSAMHESAKHAQFCPACGSEDHTVIIDEGAPAGAETGLDVEGDDFRDEHERAMRDHLLANPGTSDRHHTCDDLCSDDIVTRLAAALASGASRASRSDASGEGN